MGKKGKKVYCIRKADRYWGKGFSKGAGGWTLLALSHLFDCREEAEAQRDRLQEADPFAEVVVEEGRRLS